MRKIPWRKWFMIGKFRSLATLLAVSAAVYAQDPSAPRTTGCLHADIAIVADMSNSIQGSEAFVWDAVAALPARFEMGDEGVRLALVRFHETASVVTELTGDRDLFLRNLATTRKTGADPRSTNILSGLRSARAQFETHPRAGVVKWIILITDGMTQADGAEEILEARALRKMGIGILGVHSPLTMPPWAGDEEDPSDPPYNPLRDAAEREIRDQWAWGGRHLKAMCSESRYYETEFKSIVKLFEDMTICA